MNAIDWNQRLSAKQIRILRQLRDNGAQTQTQLNVRGIGSEYNETLHDLYRLKLADGWFRQSGISEDDRYWEITEAGKSCLNDVR